MIQAVIHRVRTWRTDGPSTIHECRRCGTSVARPDEPCPYCGTARIATYEF